GGGGMGGRAGTRRERGSARAAFRPGAAVGDRVSDHVRRAVHVLGRALRRSPAVRARRERRVLTLEAEPWSFAMSFANERWFAPSRNGRWRRRPSIGSWRRGSGALPPGSRRALASWCFRGWTRPGGSGTP